MAADNRDDEALPPSEATPTEPGPSATPSETSVEQPDDAVAAPTEDRVPSDPWAETEIRPVPPEIAEPGRVAPGGTSLLPPVPPAPGEAAGPVDPGGAGSAPPRWTARAQVRTPDVEEEEVPQWAEPPRSPFVPSWWRPAFCCWLLWSASVRG
jgi:hypothetical protein